MLPLVAQLKTWKRGQFWPKPLWDKSVVPIGNLWGTFWEHIGNTQKTTTKLGLLCECCIASKLAEQNCYSSLCLSPFSTLANGQGLIPLINVMFQCKKCSVKHWAFLALKYTEETLEHLLQERCEYPIFLADGGFDFWINLQSHD